MRQLELEEEQLAQALEDGTIDLSEYNQEMKSLQRAYQATAYEEAEIAYERALEDW